MQTEHLTARADSSVGLTPSQYLLISICLSVFSSQVDDIRTTTVSSTQQTRVTLNRRRLRNSMYTV